MIWLIVALVVRLPMISVAMIGIPASDQLPGSPHRRAQRPLIERLGHPSKPTARMGLEHLGAGLRRDPTRNNEPSGRDGQPRKPGSVPDGEDWLGMGDDGFGEKPDDGRERTKLWPGAEAACQAIQANELGRPPQ